MILFLSLYLTISMMCLRWRASLKLFQYICIKIYYAQVLFENV